MISPAQALTLAQKRKDELVDLLSRLVRVRSHSGESAEAAQEIVLDYLARLPYRFERSADKPSTLVQHAEYMEPIPAGDGPFVNVVARPREEQASRIALFAHIDTHPVEEGWVTDPYDAVIAHGRLHGLGSADGKGGTAAMLVAAAALTEASALLPTLISIHGKGGGSRGSLPVFDRLQRANEAIDLVLYAHPAETGRGLDCIKHIVRGVLDVELAVMGWQGPPLEIGLPDSARWSDGGDALRTCWQAIEHLRQSLPSGAELNVGRLEAGRAAGSVPQQAFAAMRILFDGNLTWRGLMQHLESALSSFSSGLLPSGDRFRLSITTGDMRCNPGAVAWGGPATLAVRSAVRDVAAIAPVSYPNHYGGDIRFPIRLLGVPAFGIGSVAGNFYGPNEWVDIDDLVRLVAVTIHIASQTLRK